MGLIHELSNNNPLNLAFIDNPRDQNENISGILKLLALLKLKL
jgi:hypothetical protein